MASAKRQPRDIVAANRTATLGLKPLSLSHHTVRDVRALARERRKNGRRARRALIMPVVHIHGWYGLI